MKRKVDENNNLLVWWKKQDYCRSLSGLASMVCTINASGGTLNLPDATNPIVDLTSAMPAPVGVTFNSAVLAYATTTDGEAKYTYSLDFDYNTHHIVVELAHIPNATTTNLYRGQLTYRISSTIAGGSNCPEVSGSTPVTRYGSLVYNRTAASAMTMAMTQPKILRPPPFSATALTPKMRIRAFTTLFSIGPVREIIIACRSMPKSSS